jgi:hypothetical protein
MSGSTSNNIIGSGSDSIVLNMAEDQAAGEDAQFSVNVDGQQIGGLQTVTASQSAGQTEAFTFEGDFAPGPHVVTVTFANNFIYPGTAGDRNVYVDGITYDGQTISTTTTGIYNAPLFPPTSTVGPIYGHAQYTVNDTTAIPAGTVPTPTTTPAAVSVGSGADNLVLNMAEDPYLGDAQFTVSVDGQQIGGVQTTTALVQQGQFQEFDIHGNFGAGTHTVAVTFLNDLVGGYYPAGTPGLPPGGPWALDLEDRNLYVLGASLDGGTPASGAPLEESGDGTQTFTVTSGSNPSATALDTGLFGSDGAAASSNNAAITASSLSSGTTTSGMTFVATPTTSTTTTDSSSATTSSSSGTTTTTTDPTAATTTTDPTATTTTTDPTAATTTTDPTTATTTTDPTATTTTTDPTATVASATTGTTQTTADFAVPTATASSTTSDTTTASASVHHHVATTSGTLFHHHS